MIPLCEHVHHPLLFSSEVKDLLVTSRNPDFQSTSPVKPDPLRKDANTGVDCVIMNRIFSWSFTWALVTVGVVQFTCSLAYIIFKTTVRRYDMTECEIWFYAVMQGTFWSCINIIEDSNIHPYIHSQTEFTYVAIFSVVWIPIITWAWPLTNNLTNCSALVLFQNLQPVVL